MKAQNAGRLAEILQPALRCLTRPTTNVPALAALQSAPVRSHFTANTSSTGSCSNARPATPPDKWRHTATAAVAGGLAVTALLTTVATTEAKSDLLPSTDKQAVDVYDLDSVRGVVPDKITLYQYHICPFCCKVRAYLDYNKIPYTAIEVNPLTKKEIKFSTYRKVPIMILDSTEQVNDSSLIISRLEAAKRAGNKEDAPSPRTSLFSFRNTLKYTLSDPIDRSEERKWREWVDERFVKVITANIYRSWGETWQTFGYISGQGNFGRLERELARTSGAMIMYVVGRSMPQKYKIEGDLRDALYKEADSFVRAVGNKDFLGGKQPNLADLAVFGVLRAIIGTDAFNDLMKESSILPWYKRMMDVVGQTSEILSEGAEQSQGLSQPVG